MKSSAYILSVSIALLLLLVGCKSTSTVERDRTVDSTSVDRRSSQRTEIRDCTITLPRLHVEETFDTLPIGQPVYAFNDSLGTRVQLLRDELNRVRARVDVEARDTTIKRIEVTRIDTIYRDRLRERKQTTETEVVKESFWRRSGAWLVGGVLLLASLAFATYKLIT